MAESSEKAKGPAVVFIALDQEATADEHIRRKLNIGSQRAERQARAVGGLDIASIQRTVNEHLAATQLMVDDRYVGLLDLINLARNNGNAPAITADDRYLSMARMVTLNGIYFHDLLSREGFTPHIIQNYSLERESIPGLLAERPLAVAISSNFLYLDDIREMALAIKKLAPEVPVIVGGALVKKVLDPGRPLKSSTTAWLESFRGAVDYFVVESQGERSFLELLRKLENGDSPETAPNLAFFHGNGSLTFTDPDEEPVDLDRTAVAWDRIPRRYLRSTLPVNTSRGCMYTCRFCTYRKLVKGVHYKSLDTLRRELKLVEGLGFVNHVRFTDDNFTANPKRLREVLSMMIEEDFSFTWSSFARSDSITPETARLMRESKCDFLDMGIESGSARILQNMDKRLSTDAIRRAVELLNENRIYGAGAFIVGFPGETEETVQETVDLINDSGLPYYHLNLFYYSSGMPVHSQREEYGLKGLGLAWKHNTMDSVSAARIIRGLPDRIHGSYTDGITSTWETFKILRGEGYAADQIRELFRLKRELEMTSNGHGASTQDPSCTGLLGAIAGIVPVS